MISPPSLLTSFLLLKIPIMGKRGRQQGKRRSESPSRGPGKESQDEEEGGKTACWLPPRHLEFGKWTQGGCATGKQGRQSGAPKVRILPDPRGVTFLRQVVAG